jgi:hypothetical protein
LRLAAAWVVPAAAAVGRLRVSSEATCVLLLLFLLLLKLVAAQAGR